MRYPLTEKQIFPFRPKPFFFITTSNPEELTVEEFIKSLTHLKETGFGGIVLFNKPIEGFNAEKYLSDAYNLLQCLTKIVLCDYFPWSTDFESSFKDAYGYEITPYMADVLNRKDIPQSADYWKHAGRLFQRWFKGNHEWMKKAGYHDFSFKVYNSMANAMETYLEDGGILAGGVLKMITK